MDQNKIASTIINDRLEKTKNLLIVKGKEYIRNDDVFHNFNVGSKITGDSPEKVLDGFMLKHYVSYKDIINDINNNNKYPDYKTIDEKIGDLIAYLCIQEALIKTNILKREDGRSEEEGNKTDIKV